MAQRDITRERYTDGKPNLRRYHQAKWDEPVIFELHTPGERGIVVPPVEQEIADVARQMLADNDDIGAILLECTELSPHAVAVQEATRLPVWDYTTLTKWIYSGCIRRPFSGHL